MIGHSPMVFERDGKIVIRILGVSDHMECEIGPLESCVLGADLTLLGVKELANERKEGGRG